MSTGVRTLALVLAASACGTPATPGTDAGLDAGAPDAPRPDAFVPSPDDAGTDAAELLAAIAEDVVGYVGEDVVLDASASTGAATYEWWPGDGRRLPRGADPVAHVTFTDPGHYSASLLVYDGASMRRTASVLVTIVRRPVFVPRASSSVAALGTTLAIVSPDSDELTTYEVGADGTLVTPHRVTVCDRPRTVTAVSADRFAVACQEDARLAIVPRAGGAPTFVTLPRASRPYGVIALDADRVVVSLEATGELALVSTASATLVRTLAAIADARALALLPDGRVVVSRLRSPDSGGELAVIDVATGARTPITLAVDPQIASDTEIGGVPTYLASIAVSPDGTRIAVAGMQVSLQEGGFRSGRPLRFDTALRAMVASIDTATLTEDFARRRQLDNRGFASAAAFSPLGDFLYVATRGNRTVERIDVLRDVASGSVQDVGLALEGLALVGGTRFAVDAFRSREVVLVEDAPHTGLATGARAAITAREPLAADVARGGVLFDDSADTRIAADGYMACAHCHLEGHDDHRVWDFSDRGEGLRNTIELVGRAGAAPIHWSANFDEVQDFESDVRNAFGGRGLLADADWATHMTTLGPSRAGLSADLDALAAYVRSLSTFPPSPHRAADGSLPPAAVRGRAIFERADVGCTTCHAGADLTDSAFVSPGVPRLHDVGTLGAGSGHRLGAALTGLDTPTLHGVWGTAPYLHDGSAATLREVLVERNAGDRHGATSLLSASAIDDLVAYLLCLDGRTD